MRASNSHDERLCQRVELPHLKLILAWARLSRRAPNAARRDEGVPLVREANERVCKSVILDKIERATVFIADVSLINSGFDRRPLTPNPNVLFELGYAVRALGWERILLVFNQASGSIEQLPFDIRAHRPVVYALADTDGDRASVRKDLVSRMTPIESARLALLRSYCFSRSDIAF